MSPGFSTVIYPVHDLARAKALFGRLLGQEPVMDQPYYVGFRVGDLDVGLDPNGHAQGMTGPVGYWQVEDISAAVQAFLEAGGSEQQAFRDVGGGKLVGTVTDADGNTIGLIQSP
jgi:predicted enzyme related to lactoylglutathione lyase